MFSFFFRRDFPVDKLVLAGVVGKGLHDVGPGPKELPVELLDGLWVLDCGLGGPGPGLDVASLLQLEYEASISDDRAGSQTLKNVLHNKMFRQMTIINGRKGC